MPKHYNKKRLAKEFKQKSLTLYENFIFEKIRKDFLDVNTILSMRNKFTQQQLSHFKLQKQEVSITSIYNTIKNIEKKLGSSILLTKEQKNHLFIPKGSIWRLHASAFTIQILDATNKYLTTIKTKNKTIEENNTIQFYKNKLTIYSNTDFFGKTVEECLSNEANYWNNFLKIMQSKYQILLIKRNKTNIYEFRKHIAHIDNPIAKHELKKGKDYQIKDDNGELIFVIDDSFKFKELESVHKTKVVRNASRVESFMKDLDRNNESLNLGELTQVTSSNAINIKKLIQLASQVPVLNQNQLILEKKMEELIQVNTILTNNIIQLTNQNKEKVVRENFIPVMDYFN